jgi:hypothetical protein
MAGGGGGDLSNALNSMLGQNILDSALPLDSRRDLWRFCDAMTRWVSMGLVYS